MKVPTYMQSCVWKIIYTQMRLHFFLNGLSIKYVSTKIKNLQADYLLEWVQQVIFILL